MSTFTTPEEAIRYLKSLGMTSEQIVEQVFAVPQPESQPESAIVPTVGVQFLPVVGLPVGKIPSVRAPEPCLIQEWEESEKGYGVRPDGFSVHRDEQDLADFIQEHWHALPASVPDTYSRPSGSPRAGFLTSLAQEYLGLKNGVYVSKAVAEQCLASKR